MFNTISSLRPYFFSLRELYMMDDPDKQKVSLDIRIPIKWQAESILDNMGPSDVAIKVQDKNENNKLISILASPTKEGYDMVFNVAKRIVQDNQEEEEKIKLFNEKVEELKSLFLSSSLDKLKDISFEKQQKKDGIRNRKSAGEIGTGKEEGSGTN